MNTYNVSLKYGVVEHPSPVIRFNRDKVAYTLQIARLIIEAFFTGSLSALQEEELG
jgi:hypothetical protein